MKGLARLCREGQLEDALLAVVVETRENFRVSVEGFDEGFIQATMNIMCTHVTRKSHEHYFNHTGFMVFKSQFIKLVECSI